MLSPVSDPAAVAQQLRNLATMAERTGTPAFQSSFRATLLARAKAHGSFLTYRNAQGHLVREWPATSRLELLSE